MDFFDFDGDFFDHDIDNSEIEIDSIPESYNFLETQSNVSFEGNKVIGNKVYLDKGCTTTLEPAGGGLGEEHPKVYVESGTNTRYIFDGNNPIKIDGKNQVTYNGRKWNLES